MTNNQKAAAAAELANMSHGGDRRGEDFNLPNGSLKFKAVRDGKMPASALRSQRFPISSPISLVPEQARLVALSPRAYVGDGDQSWHSEKKRGQEMSTKPNHERRRRFFAEVAKPPTNIDVSKVPLDVRVRLQAEVFRAAIDTAALMASRYEVGHDMTSAVDDAARYIAANLVDQVSPQDKDADSAVIQEAEKLVREMMGKRMENYRRRWQES